MTFREDTKVLEKCYSFYAEMYVCSPVPGGMPHHFHLHVTSYLVQVLDPGVVVDAIEFNHLRPDYKLKRGIFRLRANTNR